MGKGIWVITSKQVTSPKPMANEPALGTGAALTPGGCSSAISLSIVCWRLGLCNLASPSPLGETLPLRSTWLSAPWTCGRSEQRKTSEQPCSNCHIFQMPAGANGPGGEHTTCTHTGGFAEQDGSPPCTRIPGVGLIPSPSP